MIDVNQLTVRLGHRLIFDNASVHIADNQKIGLVGNNGCGKSTFFKCLLNQLDTMDGEIILPANARIAYVEQSIADTEMSVVQYVLSKDTELMSLRNQLNSVSEIEKPEIMDRLKLLDSDGAEGRIAHILNGLGFENDDFDKPVKAFSGGWRMRLSLAGALFQYSDVLLLDEPTNHLDLEATIWLEEHLHKYKGTLILISHDRMILNKLCDRIMHIENHQLKLYTGNFDTFEQTRHINRQQQMALAEKLTAKRAHMQAYIDRFRYKASKAKQAQSRIKMLEKMADIPVILQDETDCFSFPKPERLAPPLITLDDVSAGYEDKTVLRKLSLSVGINERIVLLGRNGNGKSTFAKLLTGKIKPQNGHIHRLSGLKIGYFAQHQEEELPLDETPLDFFTPLMSAEKPVQIRSYLARFGIDAEKAVTKIRLLSGGEKARLIFAQIALEKPALLVLDEPTNHLDMKGREALLSALNDFEGSVILITHDFHLIELFADDLWLIDKERCLPFLGDLSDYRRFLLKQNTSVNPIKENVKQIKKNEGTEKRISAVQSRQIKAKMGQLEREMDKLTQQKENCHQLFETPLNGMEIREIQNRLKEIENKLADIEYQWLELSEQLV